MLIKNYFKNDLFLPGLLLMFKKKIVNFYSFKSFFFVSILFVFGFLIHLISNYRSNVNKKYYCDPKKDYPVLSENKISPKYLQILVNQENICKIDKLPNLPFVLGYVFNKADNYEKRRAIRRTWANRENFPNLKIAFMVGLSKDKNINELVKEEANLFSDIIVGNYIESYRNLSFKSVMAWEWIHNYCDNADYILKVDDDILIDTFSFMNFIELLFLNKKDQKNSFYCFNEKKNYPVVRDAASKFYTTCEEYKYEFFGEYCRGWIYIITPELVSKLHQASYNIRSFFIDDVYVGFVTQYLNISIIDISEKFSNLEKESKTKDIVKTEIIFAPDVETTVDMNEIWNLILIKKNKNKILKLL